nr:MAG TPA_asm: hypothetical protein [Caudoviricetes sp.]
MLPENLIEKVTQAAVRVVFKRRPDKKTKNQCIRIF